MQAKCDILIAGASVFSALSKRLISVSVTLPADGQASSATLTIDDTDGAVILPKLGRPIAVLLGWQPGGIRPVFAGTVDEVRSSGGRSGRILNISAKGFDATGAAKGQQRRHWDDKTVKTILQDAAKDAGIDAVSVDPALAAKVIDYFSMMDESFLAMGRRLAKEIGGHFRVEGERAVMSKRGATYAPIVMASWGLNLHTWDIRPTSSRDLYGKVKAPWYDKKAAKWEAVEVETGLESTAVLTLRETSATKEEAQRRADARAETVKQSAGEGSVTIEGDTGAVPDGLCLVTGTRPGIDGTYRIASVSHSYSRSGFTTDIQLSQPQGGAGKDSR
jgi:phage protein D